MHIIMTVAVYNIITADESRGLQLLGIIIIIKSGFRQTSGQLLVLCVASTGHKRRLIAL